MKKLFLLLPLAFLTLTGCSGDGANDAGKGGNGGANVTENGGENAATGTILAELTIDGEIPVYSGWTYIGSDAEHTTPAFYSNDGIKTRFVALVFNMANLLHNLKFALLST